MTFDELCDEVYILTNRDDLVGETKAAVRAATLKLHQADYFYKDLFETGVSFSTSDYLQQIEYRPLIPTWRSLKYIRKTDLAGADDLGFFEIIVPENVLDSYNINRNDVAYVAGTVIQIRSSTAFQYAILGCYVHPNITELGYNSWIANEFPYAIIFEAVSSIFRLTAETTQAAAYTDLAKMQKQDLINSNVQSTGQ